MPRNMRLNRTSLFGDEDKYSYAVSFNNILNKEYRSSLEEIPGVGRSIEASLRMKF